MALKSTFTTQLLPAPSVPVPTTQVLAVILKGLLIVTLLMFNAALPVLIRRNCCGELVLKKGE